MVAESGGQILGAMCGASGKRGGQECPPYIRRGVSLLALFRQLLVRRLVPVRWWLFLLLLARLLFLLGLPLLLFVFLL